MSRVTIVVPCYNEEHRLNVAAFQTFRDVDFLFVNDGSTDGTLRVLEAAGLRVLNLERNGGKAEAVRRGILDALSRPCDFVGFWDADLATPLNELPRFIEVMAGREEIQMVMGARVRLLGREISRKHSRHYFGRGAATLISTSLGIAVYDTQCGAKLFRSSDMMREVFSTRFLSRWIFDVEIIARLIQQMGRAGAAGAIYELPLLRWQDVQGSKVKSRDYLRGLADLWKIHRAYNARR